MLYYRTPIDRWLALGWAGELPASECPPIQVELAQATASFLKDMPVLNISIYYPLETLELIMGSPVLRHGKNRNDTSRFTMWDRTDSDYLLDLGLSPLATAILSNSEDDLKSILLRHPHSIRERTYGMTALHLSSRWPAGLSILLSTSAEGLIDEACADGWTAVDVSAFFGCEEAVALLFDAGCSWNGFRVRDDTYPRTILLECVRTIAHKLAERRRRLMRLATEILTETQLSTAYQGDGILDSDAAAVVRLLRDAGVDVPDALAVPDEYMTIYLSGCLDIAYFPIFYDSGFHDVNHFAHGGIASIQFAGLEVFRAGVDGADENLLASGISQWLEDHAFLDLAPAHALRLGTNTSATGRHILAVRLAVMHQDFRDQRMNYQLLRGVWRNLFTVRATDDCRCGCSSIGCFPLTKGLKAAAEKCWPIGRVPFLCRDSRTELWQAVQSEMAGELLRFLTFEALEMTHTCCKATWGRYLGGCSGGYFQYLTLWKFGGIAEEIHDDEEELYRRLEGLLSEFHARYAESGEDLCDFVWGYWRERMTEECVPAGNEDEIVGDESGVKLVGNCE